MKKHVNSYGLKTLYESDIDFGLKVKSLMALSFVPPAEVLTVFGKLSETFPETDACDKLLKYFKNTFVQGEGRLGRTKDPLFPIPLWNHYQDGLDCVPKTTNCTGLLI